ncbi:hypothetical protein NAEGRDRAFT_59796 [Naegleria gruberi]|uniref:N-terminal Ras-GEF domain-containing protein n=1 Tax=Naegleria gruberi TaxID=5762 RepID=D2W0Y1_NAEGR|nr:uncharacterized protein NAEGRDRAFT_59796 [Naegleria gruberi]EFC37223.1 hypothetical protein NAEGRDRAFT_59796 [Naegleria gruberi]|eukprot:XP_002669967.1 hypothetical protein NAEGRDRAFT_59796 [Naegleria gruberi strain NEG-M]
MQTAQPSSYHLDGINNCSNSYLFIKGCEMPFSDGWINIDVGLSSLRLFEFKSEEIFGKIKRIGIKKIVCGDYHAIFLLNDGTAFGYGQRTEGQLMVDRNSKQHVVEIPLSNIEDVYCGSSFTYCLIRKSKCEFKMVSFGQNINECCSQRKEEGDRDVIHCNLGDVYYWNDGYSQPMEFPPPNEIVLDVKCGAGKVAILTKHYKDNQRFLYSIGIYEKNFGILRNKYLSRRILWRTYDNTEYLTLFQNYIVFHMKEGLNYSDEDIEEYSNRMFSERFQLDYFGKLFELPIYSSPPRYQILPNVKIEKIVSDLAALSAEGVMTIYYSHLLFNPTLYQKNRTRDMVGVAKINLSLKAVANYLSTIRLLGSGYVVLGDNSGTYLGASLFVNSTTNTIFDLTDRNAGLLLRQFFNMNGNSTNFDNSTSFIMVGELDEISYIITPLKYRLENVDWNIFFILYEQEVTATLMLTTYISIGVTAGVVIIGLLSSLFIGLVVSRPMKFLEKQFKLIKVFDLDNVVSNKSVFREVNSIFNNLDETIDWLKEIKSFVPPYILEQIQNSEQVQKSNTQETVGETNRKSVTSFHSQPHSKGESGASFHTVAQSSYKNSKSLFKMGLIENPSAIITIRTEADSPHILEEAFKELVVALGPVVKVSQGNLQIISYNHFQLSFTANQLDSKLAEKAFETALKIFKASRSIKNPIDVRMGVCVNKSHSGNLGTNTSRHYMVVGKAVELSDKYCELASLMKVNIISDLASFQKSEKFIARPLDRIGFDMEKVIVWEVIDKKNEENDEWLYELERSKENNKFKEYSKVFEMLEEKFWEVNRETDDVIGELGKSISVLENWLNSNNKDSGTVEKLLNHLRKVMNNSYDNISQLKDFVMSYSTAFVSKKLM